MTFKQWCDDNGHDFSLKNWEMQRQDAYIVAYLAALTDYIDERLEQIMPTVT